MPQENSRTRLLYRVMLVSAIGYALVDFARTLRILPSRAWDEWDEQKLVEPAPVADDMPAQARRIGRRRLATTLAFASLFFAGAALSAGAGDQVRGLLDSGENAPAAAGEAAGADATTTETTDTTATAAPEPAPEAPAEPPAGDSSLGGGDASAAAQAAEGSDSGSAHGSSVSASASDSAPAHRVAAAPEQSDEHDHEQTQSVVVTSGSGAKSPASSRRAKPKRKPAKPAPLDPEVADAGGVTVWLNRPLPDPTPPSLRLTRAFASRLATTARSAHADWALMLAVLRAKGLTGSSPAGPAELRSLAARLSGPARRNGNWAAAFSFSKEMLFADRAAAVANYYRAVGLSSLVRGLEASKRSLEHRVLNDTRVSMYPGGRDDVAREHVNVRVLALVEYMAESFGQVSVSCLISGHRLYARPGVVSAHIYGLAADISSLGGVSIAGHQQPGSVTERAVRDMLFLPREMLPRQVISLLGLGGPSFPLANHWDHLHVGY